MDVFLRDDGRVFEEGPDDKKITYEVGDVAWFEEDVLLVVAVKDGRAEAIEHPAARQMMEAALASAKKTGSDVFAEAMRIHARAMTKLWMATVGSAAVGRTKLRLIVEAHGDGPWLRVEVPSLPAYFSKLDEAMCASFLFAAAILPGEIDLTAFTKKVEDLSRAKGAAYDAETAALNEAASKGLAS